MKMSISTRFSAKNLFTTACLSYETNSMCAGNLSPLRMQPWIKLYFRRFEPDLITLKCSGCPESGINFGLQLIFWDSRFWATRAFKSYEVGPKRRKMKLDLLLDAPGSKLSSAHRISFVRQARERETIFFWKSGPDWHFHLNSQIERLLIRDSGPSTDFKSRHIPSLDAQGQSFPKHFE